MRNQVTWAVAASALVALAVWPFAQSQYAKATVRDPIMALTPAPLSTNYVHEGEIIRTYERHDNAAGGPLIPRLLSSAYMQRYRETGDVDDILRAKNEARKSLAAQPRGNIAATLAIASADTALHRFHEAIDAIESARVFDRGDAIIGSALASNFLEIGNYAGAKTVLDRLSPDDKASVSVEITLARYAELTDHADEAKRLVTRAMRVEESISTTNAENRAWYHFRLAELAFATGDNAGAIAEGTAALTIFPNYWHAATVLARVYAAQHDWKSALASAEIADRFAPLPETLGIEADAHAALGDADAAAAKRDEIVAIERVGNAQHLSDRLLAVYYDDHGIRLADAYAIAKRELAVRDDVFADDTIAWAAARIGKWPEAEARIAKALAYDTPDARMHYHAGTIFAHAGKRDAAKREFARALALNATFHPTFADDARAQLAKLQ